MNYDILNALKVKETRQKILEIYFGDILSKDEIAKIENNIANADFGAIERYWKKYQNLRFIQVLINLGLVKNYRGFYYYIKDDEIITKIKNETYE